MERNDPEETLAEICERADAERNFESLLQQASRIQRLISAQQSQMDLPKDEDRSERGTKSEPSDT